MVFATTSNPGGRSLGTQDNSRVKIPAEPKQTSMTMVLAYILAPRGRSRPTIITSGADSLYGAEAFEQGSAFYTHSNKYLNETLGLGLPALVRRIIPAGAKKALLRLSVEVIASDLPLLKRNSDGSLKTVTDPQTGVTSFESDGTIKGSRVILHVGVAPYAEDKRGFKQGNVIDNYRLGSVTVNGKFLGEITRGDGSKEHPSSRLFPIADFLVDSEGEYGNNLGLRISTPSILDENPLDASNAVLNRAFGLRVGVVERANKYSTATPVPLLSNDLVQDVYLKPRAKDSISNKSIYLPKKMIDSYERKEDAVNTPIWGPFGGVYLYDTNISALQQMLSEGYVYTDTNGNDIAITGEKSYDDEAFDYGRTADYAFSNSLNYGYLNFLTGKDIRGVPLYSLSTRDSLMFGGAVMDETAVHYASGGSDGLWYFPDGTPADVVNLKLFDDAVRAELNNFGEGTDKLKDILRYPFTHFADSGYSLDTKLATAKLLKARPDITLRIGTQAICDNGVLTVDIGPVYNGNTVDAPMALSTTLLDKWDWQPRLDATRDLAIATKLRTHFNLYPESVFFNTPVMRVMVFGHAGTAVFDDYDYDLPGSFDRSLAMDRFTSGTRWSQPDDFTEDDNRKPQFLKDMSYFYRDDAGYSNAWDAGMNFLRSHDANDDFWPAIQTIYPYKDSILNNGKFALVASRCHYFGMEVWRAISGENKTDLQFKQDLEDEANRVIVGRFTDDVTVVPEAILSDADVARGYSGYIKFHVAVGSPRTQLAYSVHGYKADQLNQTQGLPGQ